LFAAEADHRFAAGFDHTGANEQMLALGGHPNPANGGHFKTGQ